jgi:hypothetical protein
MDLVMEQSWYVNPEFCKEISTKFKEYSLSELTITNYKQWNDISNKIKTDEFLNLYTEFFSIMFPNSLGFKFNVKNFVCFDIMVQEYETPIWKTEVKKFPTCVEQINFIICLSDDGEIDFVYKKIKFEYGKLLVFPCTWVHLYSIRGCALTGCFYLKC